MSATECIRKNYLILRKNTTNLGDVCAFFFQNETLNLDEIERIKNPYTNASSEDKNEKLYEFLMRKEIPIELFKDAFESSGNSPLLEKIAWPSGPGGASSGKKIFWNVPRRNQMFVGRQEILAEISKSFESKEKYKSVITTACKGLGGIGKTTIATQYAWMNRDVKNVFWFGAEKAENLKSQMEDLKKKHGVNSEWFESHEDWLLIFDNVEKPADIVAFIPKYHGHILITSRNIQWEDCTRIDIEIFTIEETRRLCKEILDEHLDDEEVDALGSELGYLPLALTIALFYMKRHLTPISDYLKKFREKKHDMLMIGPELGFLNQLPSVYSTWMISYEKMVKESPIAAQFLVLCAYYPDPDEIYFGILNYFVFIKTDKFTMYDQIREILIKYSMVKVEGESFKIHRLVQQVLKIQFRKNEEENMFIFCRLMMSDHFYINESSFNNFEDCEEICAGLERINQQNVFFRLLVYLENKIHGNISKKLVQKNYKKYKSQLLGVSNFEKILAHFGYLYIWNDKRDYYDKIPPCLDWIIKSYGELKPEEKPEYWEFFATLFATFELNNSVTPLNNRTIKRLESIVKILQQDFDNPQVKYISHLFAVNILERLNVRTFQRFNNYRSIKYCKILIGTIQELKNLQYCDRFIYRIYTYVGEAYLKIGHIEKASKYFDISNKIYLGLPIFNKWPEKISRNIKICTEKLNSIEKFDDELIAKIYSEYGFKEKSLKHWKLVTEKPDVKYQNFIEMSLIYHQITKISKSIDFFTEALNKAKGGNICMIRKFNQILGYLTKISENWDYCIEIQNILKTDFEEKDQICCSDYINVIENMSFCHFAKGDENIARDLLRNAGMDSIFQVFNNSLENMEYQNNYLHLIDFPMIELISDDLNYRVCKIMEYSDYLRKMCLEEILYALKFLVDYENSSVPNIRMSKDRLCFKISLMDNILRAHNVRTKESKGGLNIKEYTSYFQNYIETLRDILGEDSSSYYKNLNIKGREFLSIDKFISIQFFSEALKHLELKNGDSNIKCIPALFYLEDTFNWSKHFEESLNCCRRIFKIFVDSDLGEYEGHRVEYEGIFLKIMSQREHDVLKSEKCDCEMCEDRESSFELIRRFEEEFNMKSDT